MKYKSKVVQNDLKKILFETFVDSIPNSTSFLITGCNGMIATYFIYFLLYLNDNAGKNIKIYATTRNINKTKQKYDDIFDRKDIKFIEHDVTSSFDFDFNVDYLFHLASSADPKNILEKPVDIIKANTIGLMNALEYARKTNIKKIMFASTREVYGKMDDNCEEVVENSLGIIDQLGVRACYPESKKMAECILNSYSLQYGVPYVIFRIAHAYGPGMPIENDGRIMSDLINNVVNNEDIILKSDGSAIRGFCYLTDLIFAIMYATFMGENNNVYNIGNEDENISILELARLMISLYPEKELNLIYKESTAQEKEAYCKFKRVKMNTDKIRKLGWKPKIKLKEGLISTIESFIDR